MTFVHPRGGAQRYGSRQAKDGQNASNNRSRQHQRNLVSGCILMVPAGSWAHTETMRVRWGWIGPLPTFWPAPLVPVKVPVGFIPVSPQLGVPQHKLVFRVSNFAAKGPEVAKMAGKWLKQPENGPIRIHRGQTNQTNT